MPANSEAVCQPGADRIMPTWSPAKPRLTGRSALTRHNPEVGIMDAAALPSGVEHLGDGAFDALMSVRDDELNPTQTTSRELAQECGPECLGLGGTYIHA